MLASVFFQVFEGLVGFLGLQYRSNLTHFVSLMSQDHLNVLEYVILHSLAEPGFFSDHPKEIGGKFALNLLSHKMAQPLVISRVTLTRYIIKQLHQFISLLLVCLITCQVSVWLVSFVGENCGVK